MSPVPLLIAVTDFFRSHSHGGLAKNFYFHSAFTLELARPAARPVLTLVITSPSSWFLLWKLFWAGRAEEQKEFS